MGLPLSFVARDALEELARRRHFLVEFGKQCLGEGHAGEGLGARADIPGLYYTAPCSQKRHTAELRCDSCMLDAESPTSCAESRGGARASRRFDHTRPSGP